MWKKLFKKLDRMSGEMETLSQGQAKINKRYVSMWKIAYIFIIYNYMLYYYQILHRLDEFQTQW